MDRFDLRELCVQLYYTATGKHDVDDQQWNIILDTFNKRYWREAAKSIGSLVQLDTPDLTANIAGGLDYSGSLYGHSNDIVQPIQFGSSSVWTATNATVTAAKAIDPRGNLDATLWTNPASPGVSTLATTALTTLSGGTIDIYFKNPQTSALTFLYINITSGTVWFDTFNATVKTNTISGSQATVTPAPYPGFPYQVGVTSAATPTANPTGWYRASIVLPNTATSSVVTFGISNADNVTATSANEALLIWGARRTALGTPTFSGSTSNMIDPNGVHMITAVELKYLGRYIHLDYEIPQDRYIYNIAFGQVQALIPNAYTIMGEQILLLPKTTGSQVLRVSYIPRMPDWVDDNVEALNGFLPEWHHLVAYESVALQASTMDPKGSAALVALRNELRDQWNTYTTSRQRQGGRVIRFVPYE